MRILLTGANGFIGRYLLAGLVKAGHDVVPAVRAPKKTDRLLPKPASVRADFNQDTTVDDWLPRLQGIDAVINCAGVLQGGRAQSMVAIHATSPMALFRACEIAGVRRVIQVSAVSVGAHTEYARTKRVADEFLATTDLDWVVLRPSLIYAEGAFGGTALLRALAAFPFVIPLVGSGSQTFQPIHMADFVATVLRIFEEPSINRVVLAPVGPDRLTMREMLVDLRRWLGFPIGRRRLQVPVPLVRLAARLGDIFGGTINTTALQQLEFGNTASVESFAEAVRIAPRPWRAALLANPSQVQDRWHARLYFVRPLLRWSIALTWIVSALSGFMSRTALAGHFHALGVALTMQGVLAACILDLLVGVAVLVRWRTQAMAIVQLAIVAGYTVAVTLADRSLWLAPFGPILKNLPFAAAILALAAMERER